MTRRVASTLMALAFCTSASHPLASEAVTADEAVATPSSDVRSDMRPTQSEHISPGKVPQAWLSSVESYVQASEYDVRETGRRAGPRRERTALGHPVDHAATHSASNREQGLRFHFGREGVRFEPRVSDGVEWAQSLSASLAGAGGVVGNSSAGAELSVDGSSVAYDRPSFSEEYVNLPAGLEHRIRITAAGGGLHSALQVRFAGDLALSEAAPNTFDLSLGDTALARYEILGVSDADGRPVAATAAIDEDSRAIAVSPVQEPPGGTLTLVARLTGLGSSADWEASGDVGRGGFGFSVATAGDVNGDGYSDVVIGAPDYDAGAERTGRAFLYLGSPTGLSWLPDWQATGEGERCRLGASVATAGDVNADGYSDIIIGAQGYAPEVPEQGAAFVWMGSETGFGPDGNPDNAYWRALGGEEGLSLGASVATAGDVNGDGYSDVIVGGPFDPDRPPGLALVYYGSLSGLSTSAGWEAHGPTPGDLFGDSVATAGDVNGDGYADVIVGAPGGRVSGVEGDGVAYAYYGSDTGLSPDFGWRWSMDAQGGVGGEVATAGDVNGDSYADVLVTAMQLDVGGGGSGAAFVFLGESSGLSDSPAWRALGEPGVSWFANSAATAGDVNADGFADVIIGQYLAHASYVWFGAEEGLGDEGRPYNADWSYVAPSDNGLGMSVATAGDVNGDGYSDLVLGAPQNGVELEGQALVFHGGAGEPTEDPVWRHEADAANSRLGTSVAGVGDLNGDGYADWGVGAPEYDSRFADEGAVFVWYGPPGRTDPAGGADWYAMGGQDNARLGQSVDTAGDVDGDGYSDLLVGATGFSETHDYEGAAFVWLGSDSGIASDGGSDTSGAHWRALGGQPEAFMGLSVAGGGDFDGDGFSDVAVGAHLFDTTGQGEGKVFVWHGAPGGLHATGHPDNAAWSFAGSTDDEELGQSVAAVGDVNGDGYSDLVAGAEGYALGWHGSPVGLREDAADWTVTGDKVSGFGCCLSGAGDVNGDGKADVIVGAPYYAVGGTPDGAVMLYYGSDGGLLSTVGWQDRGVRSDAQLGFSLDAAGDLNGDGYADFVVGAPGWSLPVASAGQARVYFGTSTEPESPGGAWSVAGQGAVALGAAVAGIGDATGDGFADLLIGEPEFAGGESEEGRAGVYAGNGSPGLAVALRQVRSDGDTPIADQARSDLPTSFGIRMLKRTPAGRGRVSLQQELRPYGEPHWGMPTGETDWESVGGLGIQRAEPVLGLEYDSRYTWRARMRYDPVTSPFAPPFGRWIHVPWRGLYEADLATAWSGKTFVVDRGTDDADAHDVNPGDGVCADSTGWCSFRAALQEANAHAGADLVTFSLPMEIEVSPSVGELPLIAGPVTIDGGTAWDVGSDIPGVTLRGGTGLEFGLRFLDNGSAVYGLHIHGFDRSGVTFTGSYNVLGGPGRKRSIITGNKEVGVEIWGPNAHYNLVHGNWIGVGRDGTSPAGNGSGVVVGGGASNNRIGGGIGALNYVAGNNIHGVLVTGSATDHNEVRGNAIGLASDGSTVVGNKKSGVLVSEGARHTLVGGPSGVGNVAVGNDTGVAIRNAPDSTVSHNVVGGSAKNGINVLDSEDCRLSDNLSATNGESGIRVAGTLAIRNRLSANSISDNGGSGIELASGANGGMSPPTISSAETSGARGRACPGCLVEVFSDDGEQAETFEGYTRADESTGEWAYERKLDGPNITATATRLDGTTSELSRRFVLGNNPPYTPSNPTPADGAGAISVNVEIAWRGGDLDGDIVTYRVMAREQASTHTAMWCTVVGDIRCSVSGLKSGTTYLWYVVAEDDRGGVSYGPLWEFTTAMPPQRYEVNSAADGDDAHDDDPGDGACADSQGRCTLRAAIEQSNARPGAAEITFTASYTIEVDDLAGALPIVTDTLTIDASSVWVETNDRPGVAIRGDALSGSCVLALAADNSAVYGLSVSGSDVCGLRVSGAHSTIGGTGAGQRNVLWGNSVGLRIAGPMTHHNVVQGNYLGPKPSGAGDDPNDIGVVIAGQAYSNTLGGATPDAGNVISANDRFGVLIESAGTSGNALGGNLIGPTPDLTGPLANGQAGVRIESGATGTRIGATGLAPNVVSFNSGPGIDIRDSSDGTTIVGGTILGNAGPGIQVTGSRDTLMRDSVIANNGSTGITISGSRATGNRITGCSIHDNVGRGIDLTTGANGALAAPAISTVTANGASGTACPSCTVEVFSDSAGQGEFYEGQVVADSTGNWTYAGRLRGPYLTSTATNAGGNTSMFSSAAALPPTPTGTPLATPTATPTPTPSPSPSATRSATATASSPSTPTGTRVHTPTATRTRVTGSPTPSATGSASPPVTPTADHTPPRTVTPELRFRAFTPILVKGVWP